MKSEHAGIDSSFSETRRFLLLSFGTVTCISASCYLEELILKNIEGYRWFWTTAFAELFIFAASSFAVYNCSAGRIDPIFPPKAPIRLYFVNASTLALYTGLGKVAFKFVNYATGTVLKSLKLVPVMIISVTWLQRKYDAHDYAAVAFLVSSTVCFGFGEHQMASEGNYLYGFVLSFVCLGLAALQSNLTEICLKDYNVSIVENMLYINGIGAMLVLFVLIPTEASRMLVYFEQNPLSIFLLLLRSITFFVGAWLYSLLIKRHGAVAAVGVTTARKGLTVSLSFLLFNGDKSWSFSYVLGVFLFLCALVTEVMKIVSHKSKEASPA